MELNLNELERILLQKPQFERIDLKIDEKNKKAGFMRIKIKQNLNPNYYNHKDILDIVKSHYSKKGYEIIDRTAQSIIATNGKEKYIIGITKHSNLFGVNIIEIK